MGCPPVLSQGNKKYEQLMLINQLDEDEKKGLRRKVSRAASTTRKDDRQLSFSPAQPLSSSRQKERDFSKLTNASSLTSKNDFIADGIV